MSKHLDQRRLKSALPNRRRGRSSLTRRRLLKLVGRAGGAAAVYTTMKTLGLVGHPSQAQRPDLPPRLGEGVKVAILGAGIAGMTAAYELSKGGYDCTILEARDRSGGRCWTIRGGDVVEELDSRQACPFDSDSQLYFNPGPARIPHHHRGILSYCKEFGVPLQVLVNENSAAYFQDDKAFDGQPIRHRRVATDSQGYMAEMLAKAVNRRSLDAEISLEDRERLLEFISSLGALGDDSAYEGSARAGYQNPRGAALQAGELYQPLNFSELLRSDFWDYKLYFGRGYDQATTMLEPVGGMDRIAQAFERQVGSMIRYGTEVQEIRSTSQGAQITYSDADGTAQIEADYVICTFPLPVLAKIKTNFSPQFQQAVNRGAENYANAVKVGFQARRFWEEDYIYGGISWTERDITQIWYPSSGFHQDKGILVGAYIWDNDIGEPWGRLSPQQRLQAAIADGAAIHPNYGSDVSPATGITVAWEKIPYSLGGWAEWEEEDRTAAYRLLNQPQEAVYLAGEHLSYLTGWQEGAVLSAHHAIQALVDRTQSSAKT